MKASETSILRVSSILGLGVGGTIRITNTNGNSQDVIIKKIYSDGRVEVAQK